jgi:eukaryotic-like serine/threonine-protein kinase
VTAPGPEGELLSSINREGSILAEKYRIARQLGAGGMGAVFEAEHLFLKRRFAIKFLRSELLGNAELVARFRREAQASGQLEHENIASVTDFGVTPSGTPYFVMEYLQGENLSRIIKREGPLTPPRAVSLVMQACRGVAAAHARGIVHRDLKPDNLFVCPREDGSEWLKILDFGIAKIRMSTDDEGTNTKTGTTMGTPYYMSPEQARGDRNVDHRTDVYSLGAVLYEALCNSKPHDGTTYNEIIYAILSREPVSLPELRPELPHGLVGVVERAMAREPADRFASMAEFASALSPYCGASGGVAPVQPSASLRCDMPTTPSPVSLGPIRSLPQPAESEVGVTPRRARTARFVVAGFVVVVAIAAILLRHSARMGSSPASTVHTGAVATSPTAEGIGESTWSVVTAGSAPTHSEVSQPSLTGNDSRQTGDTARAQTRTGAAADANVAPASQGLVRISPAKTPATTGSSRMRPSLGSSRYDRKNPYE